MQELTTVARSGCSTPAVRENEHRAPHTRLAGTHTMTHTHTSYGTVAGSEMRDPLARDLAPAAACLQMKVTQPLVLRLMGALRTAPPRTF